MITIYTSPGCSSSRKAKAFLKLKKLSFVERNILAKALTADEIKYLLLRSENGSEDIISTRSSVYKDLEFDIDDLSTRELIQFIQDNPTLLKRPIIIDSENFVVGYDDDEITCFLPETLR